MESLAEHFSHVWSVAKILQVYGQTPQCVEIAVGSLDGNAHTRKTKGCAIPRLVICRKCQTVDLLPIFNGDATEEAADPLLDGIVGRHLNLHGLTLVNQQKLGEGHEEMKLAMVPDDVWYGQDGGAVQKQILAQMREQWTGFEPEIYAIKNTYQEDALACFNRHRRPAGTCIDWHEDSKRLTSETRHQSHVFLCDFCPVASTVMINQRKAKHMYDKEKGEVD